MASAAASASAGIVRSEGLLSERAAYYVCYPGRSVRDRIITVRENERAIAEALLRVCQALPSKGKVELQAACQVARSALRGGLPEATVIEEALRACAVPVLPGASGADAAALAAYAVVEEIDPVAATKRPALEAAPEQFDKDDVCQDTRSVLEPLGTPPLPPPAAPPPVAEYADIVGRGRSFMLDWTPSPKGDARSNDAASPMQWELSSEFVHEDTLSLAAPAAAPDPEVAARVSAMRALAREVRKTSRYIGLLPFLMYAFLREVRVHVFFVHGLVDIVAEYAPFLCGRCLETVPRRVAVFCRCMSFQYGGADHRVVRRLRSERNGQR